MEFTDELIKKLAEDGINWDRESDGTLTYMTIFRARAENADANAISEPTPLHATVCRRFRPRCCLPNCTAARRAKTVKNKHH